MKIPRKRVYSFDKYIKFVDYKISNIFDKMLANSIICSNCDNNNGRLFKEGEIIWQELEI